MRMVRGHTSGVKESEREQHHRVGKARDRKEKGTCKLKVTRTRSLGVHGGTCNCKCIVMSWECR